MAKVYAGMAMGLDGFVNDREGSVGALYPDLDALRNTEFLQESIRSTGAVVMGRHAFAMSDDPDWFAGNYEYQAPIFVLTLTAPQRHPKETRSLAFTFVTDGIESAIRQAKAAAGDRDVTVIGGADTAQQCINAGLVDYLDVIIMPVLLGAGTRLFENIAEPVRLEKVKVSDLPAGGTYFLFRVAK